MSKSSADPISMFEEERRLAVESYCQNTKWHDLSGQWLEEAFHNKYMYNFACLGRPIIQLPDDMIGFQEIVWKVRPDLIIETGIAHGGSLIQSAALLTLLDYCDAVQQDTVLDPKEPKRHVLGIDIDIRAHNKAAIKSHPMSGRIEMIQGSSLDEETVVQVQKIAEGYKRILVCLDSNHTHDHVFSELTFYAPLTTIDSYCIVFDTIVEELPEGVFPDRPWSPGNSPKTAVHAYLKQLKEKPEKDAKGQPLEFAIDNEIDNKLLLSASSNGFLKRV